MSQSSSTNSPASDPAELVKRLREACNGYPHALIPWPHRVLHETADYIEQHSTAALPGPTLEQVRACFRDWKATLQGYCTSQEWASLDSRITALYAASPPVAPPVTPGNTSGERVTETAELEHAEHGTVLGSLSCDHELSDAEARSIEAAMSRPASTIACKKLPEYPPPPPQQPQPVASPIPASSSPQET